MDNHKSIALIECGAPGKVYLDVFTSLPQNYQLKKAYVFHDGSKNTLRRRFPELEIAADCDAIFQDQTIDLVLISAPSAQHRSLIGTALKANKQVQIV